MTLLLAFVVMLLVVVGMAVGVLLGRRPIQGSCGGIARLGLGGFEICGGDPARCEAPQTTQPSAHLGYDATDVTKSASRRLDA
jgi:hypothetical protein